MAALPGSARDAPAPSPGQSVLPPGAANASAWGWDVLHAMRDCDAPLAETATVLARQTGLCGRLGLQEDRLRAFMVDIERLYDNNLPYHNAFHAADVIAGAMYLVSRASSHNWRNYELLALFVAAAGHDAGHGGRNNAFLKAVGHPLASEYPTSPLEHFHANKIRESLKKTGLLASCDALSAEERERALYYIDELVLATDMVQHAHNLTRLTASHDESRPDDISGRLSKLAVLLKLADLGNVVRPLDIANAWAVRILEEFGEQAAEERAFAEANASPGVGLGANGEMVTTFGETLADHQLGFLDKVVRPMIERVSDILFDKACKEELLGHAQRNHDAWAWQLRPKEEAAKQLQDTRQERRIERAIWRTMRFANGHSTKDSSEGSVRITSTSARKEPAVVPLLKPGVEAGNDFLAFSTEVGQGFSAAPYPKNEAERVRFIKSLKAVGTLARGGLYDAITSLAASIFHMPLCFFTLVDETRQYFVSEHGMEIGSTDRSCSFCSWMLAPEDEHTLVVHDAESDPRFRTNPLVIGPPYIRFYFGAPVVIRAGSVEGLVKDTRIGALCILDSKAHSVDAVSAEQRRVLQELANALAKQVAVTHAGKLASFALAASRSEAGGACARASAR